MSWITLNGEDAAALRQAGIETTAEECAQDALAMLLADKKDRVALLPDPRSGSTLLLRVRHNQAAHDAPPQPKYSSKLTPIGILGLNAEQPAAETPRAKRWWQRKAS